MGVSILINGGPGTVYTPQAMAAFLGFVSDSG